MRLNLLMVFAIVAAAVIPQLVLAHLLNGNKGPVDAFNYDESQLKHLDSDCAASFECKPNDVKGVYFYNCYYDVYSSECQCSKGDFSKCDVRKSSLDPADSAALKGGSGLAFPLSLAGMFSSLPLAAKIAAGVIILVAVVSLFLRLRDTINNNLRKAKALHEEATALHEKGQEEEAKLLFEKANYYREHAYEQQRT